MYDNIKSGRVVIRLMQSIGIWNFKGNKWNVYFRIYSWLLHLIFTVLFITTMFINVYMSTNMEEFSGSMYMSCCEITVLVKVIIFMFKLPKIVEIIEIMENTDEFAPKNKAEREIAEREHKKFGHLRNMYIIVSMGALLTGLSSSRLDTYHLPFPCWMPFDYHNFRNYIFALSYVVCGMLTTAVGNYSTDLYQSYLLFHVSFLYKLLGQRLQAMGNGEGGKEGVAQELRKLYKFRTLLSKLTDQVEDLISFPVMTQILLCAFVICFSMYKLQSMSISENFFGYVFFLIFVVCISMEMYLLCVYGDELTSSAEHLMTSIYCSNWTEMPVQTKKEIITFMEYLKKPVTVKAGNFFNIQLEVFTLTMSNAYRFYALMVNLKI